MTSSISVALCTHNGAAYLSAQLESIIRQSVPPQEIVISDDASHDGTRAIVTSFRDECARSHPSIAVKFIENEQPLGVTQNFQQAVLTCTGDYIALSDQDDVWLPDRLAVSRAAMESRGLSLVGGDARLINAEGRDTGETLFGSLGISPRELKEMHSGRGFDALLRRNLVTGATAMVSRRTVELAVPFPHPWVHDEWLAIIAAATGTIDLIERQLIGYRQHGGNQIGVRTLTLGEKFRKLVEPAMSRGEYLANRGEVLSERLDVLGFAVNERDRTAAKHKARHLRVRRDLSPHPISRIGSIISEACVGNYSRYSRGLADVVRDLLQSKRRDHGR